MLVNAVVYGCLQAAQILPFEAELVLATLMDSQLTAADAAADSTVRRFRYIHLISLHMQQLSSRCQSKYFCDHSNVVHLSCRGQQTKRERSPHVPSPWTNEGAPLPASKRDDYSGPRLSAKQVRPVAPWPLAGPM